MITPSKSSLVLLGCNPPPPSNPCFVLERDDTCGFVCTGQCLTITIEEIIWFYEAGEIMLKISLICMHTTLHKKELNMFAYYTT